MSQVQDLPALYTLVYILDAGSFAGAADRLALSPSAVSRRIARLEENFGIRLLERTTRRVRATDAGLRLVQQIRPLFDALGEAEDDMREHDATPCGRVRISATPAFGRACLMPVLADLGDRYPQIAFEVVLARQALDFVDDQIDLAVREGPLRNSSLVVRKLTSTGIWVCASPSYLKRAGTPVRLDDLRGHKLLSVPASGPSSDLSKIRGRDGRKLGLSPQFEVDDLFSLRDLAERGSGVVLLPDYLAAPAVRAKRLKRVLPRTKLADLAISLLYTARHLPQRVRIVRDALLEAKF